MPRFYGMTVGRMSGSKISDVKKVLKYTLAFLVILFVLLPAVAAHLMVHKGFKVEDPSATPVDSAWMYSELKERYPREEMTFPSGENILHGFLYGEGNEGPLLVFVHGIGYSHETYLSLITWFVDHGYPVFAPDLTASGKSGGNDRKGLIQSALDVDAVLSFLESDSRFGDMPKVLVGHSWGAFGVIGALSFDHDVTAVVSFAPFAYPRRELCNALSMGLGPFVQLTRPWLSLEDRIIFGKYAGLNAVKSLRHTTVPVLVVHGTGDEIISYEKSSVIAYRDRIGNPSVHYMTVDEEGRCGHESIFRAKGETHLNEPFMQSINEFIVNNL